MRTKVRWMNLVVVLLSVAVLTIMALIVFGALGGQAAGGEAKELAAAWCDQNAGMQFCAGKFAPQSYAGTVTAPDGESYPFEREQPQTPAARMERLGEVPQFTESPQTVRIQLEDLSGNEIFAGTAQEFAAFAPPNGDYLLKAVTGLSNELETGEGSYPMQVEFRYEIALTVDVQLSVYLSSETVSQGDVLLLCADGLRDPGSISAELPFEYDPVFFQAPGGCYAYIPFNYMRAEGDYEITVTCMGEQSVLTYSVTEPDYEVQHLTVSESTVSSTVGDNSAVVEYNSTMDRLAAIADGEVYWTGDFIQPVEGTITTEFGIKRYTNDAATPTRHAGIDIAAGEGVAVAASNAGRVIFADYLQVSGNTVVIEHGMGLKTFYLHMSELNCAEGDMVERGQTIGAVGMTGFATGPHLHFQAQVGSMCISPWYLFDGSSGVYLMREKQG